MDSESKQVKHEEEDGANASAAVPNEIARLTFRTLPGLVMEMLEVRSDQKIGEYKKEIEEFAKSAYKATDFPVTFQLVSNGRLLDYGKRFCDYPGIHSGDIWLSMKF